MVVLIWGINFAVMKAAVADLDPLVFNALRFTLSVAFLGLLVAREQPTPRPNAQPAHRKWWRILLLGLFGHFAYQTVFILGLERTTSGNSALLLSSSPLWTASLAHVVGWERMRRGAWFGLGLAFIGTAAIALVRPAR